MCYNIDGQLPESVEGRRCHFRRKDWNTSFQQKRVLTNSVKLPFCFLVSSVLVGVVDVLSLSFWEAVRQALISTGLICLLKRTKGSTESISTNANVAYWILCVFVIVQFPGKSLGGSELTLVRLFLLGAGIVFLMRTKDILPLAKQDKLLLAISLAVVTGFWLHWQLGKITSVENADAFGIVVQVVLCHFLVTRCLREDPGGIVKRRLLKPILALFILASIATTSQAAWASYHFSSAVSAFRDEKYSSVHRFVSKYSPLLSKLQIGQLSIDRFLETTSSDATIGKWNPSARFSVGEIAERTGAYQIAYDAFNNIYEREPEFVGVRGKLGRVLMKLGAPNDGLRVLGERGQLPSVHIGDLLTQALILCKLGEWERANEALDLAIEIGGVQSKIDQTYLAAQGKVLELGLSELLPDEFFSFADEFSEFDVVNLLRWRGWEILYHPMEIGKTDLFAPVDIEVWSDRDSSGRRERIVVDGTQVSLNRTGRNVVVLDAESGQIDTIAALGRSGLDGINAKEVSRFLKLIPRGKIVAGTIVDTGGALSEEDIRELRNLGTSGYPGNYAAQVFVGVKGAGPGTAFELRALEGVVGGGFMAGNIKEDLCNQPELLNSTLREASERSTAGISVFIPRFEHDSTIFVFASQ